MITEQMNFWQGQFGKEYTDRNILTVAGMEESFQKLFGLTRSAVNARFVGNLERSARILEVGCNAGMQLQVLQSMGFTNLTGVELQRYAVEQAKKLSEGIDVIQGSGFELPFRDGWFDVVCVNGVLVHIAPENHARIMQEVARCSKRFIWGCENYAEKLTEVNYRGHEGYLWKGDFAAFFQQHVPGLHLVKQEFYPYLVESEAGNVDAMYLLEKKS
jgi:pseudaminic acid biosynthesis-associated methylase